MSREYKTSSEIETTIKKFEDRQTSKFKICNTVTTTHHQKHHSQLLHQLLRLRLYHIAKSFNIHSIIIDLFTRDIRIFRYQF